MSSVTSANTVGSTKNPLVRRGSAGGLPPCSSRAHHRLAGADAADEADHGDAPVLGEGDARPAPAGDHVEPAGGEHVLPDLGQTQGRQRRLLG
jgi:hypothetical protein